MKDIGHQLQQARQRKKASIEDAAKELNVRPKYIRMLENGDIATVTKDIYLVGYLKSYAHWLGLDAPGLVAQFKSQSNNWPSVKGITTESSSSFFTLDDHLISPSPPIILVSTTLLVLLYIGWHFTTLHHTNQDFLPGLPITKATYTKYKGFPYAPERYKKLVLMAREPVTLQFYYPDAKRTNHQLNAGDAYFLPNTKEVIVSANVPAAIDVLSDDSYNTFFGTLEDLYLVN